MNVDDPLIFVLYNFEEQVLQKSPSELISLEETAKVAMHINHALTASGYRTIPIAVHNPLSDLRKKLAPFSPKTAFIFNNCDGFGGENMAATRVTRLIESLGFKHTGSTTRVVKTCIDKSMMKARLASAHLPSPRYQVFTQARGDCRLNFPLIVKPLTEDASLGIDLDSVVQNPADLLKRVEYVLKQYHQPALVEEYILGRELSVTVWGNRPPQVLPITEQDYARIENPLHRILTYDSKWDPNSYLYNNIMAHCPASLEPDEVRLVTQTALSVYRLLGLRDYARVDLRYHDGVPYVIDVNEIPDLGPDSGFFVSAKAAGYTYPGMITRILELAMERENWQCRPPAVKSLPPYHPTVSASLD